MDDAHEGFEEETFFTFSYSPLRDESGTVVGMFCACTETTEAVQAKRRQSVRLEFEECLRDFAEPQQVMAAAAGLLGRRLGAARVGYADIVDDAAVVEHDWTDGGAPSIVGTHPLTQFGTAMAEEMRAGRTIRVDDMATDPLARGGVAEAFAALGTRATITPTLVKNGRPVAVLFVHGAAPRRWTKDEIALVEDMAERTWAAVERARSETALRVSEGRLRTFVNATATWCTA